jgi:nitronate monooxygenase
MTQRISPVERAKTFAARVGIRLPNLLAPMAGACPPSLSIAVANAGGLGACGAVLMKPAEITAWCNEFRQHSQGDFQINLWIPEAEIRRNASVEERQRAFLAHWGPAVDASAGDGVLPDFEAQFQTIIDARPKVISSIMGLYSEQHIAQIKARGILWFATVTTAAEARAAEKAGADAILAQGMEAGGHRGAFDAREAERLTVGLFALVPQIVDSVSLPVVAAGGIADARGIAAALMLGASAAMIGTGFLRCPEAKIQAAYADRIASTEAHETMLTRAFTGRAGRAIANSYVRAAAVPEAPTPAAYPVQRGFTAAIRDEARKAGDTDRMQMWAGQSAKLASPEPAGQLTQRLWHETSALLAGI